MTSLVILPGLDGTARLLDRFVRAASRRFSDVLVIAYPTDHSLDYPQLQALVRDEIAGLDDFVLLGESFSGPIALSLAAERQPGLRGLVLSTTFARSPVAALSMFAGLVRYAPARLPIPLLSWALLGPWSTAQIRRDLRAALASVAPAVLRQRAANALRIDVSDALPRVQCPTLCLLATHDRLLSPAAGKQLAQAIPTATCCSVTGPHLLLQTAPEHCATLVAEHFGFMATGTT